MFFLIVMLDENVRSFSRAFFQALQSVLGAHLLGVNLC